MMNSYHINRPIWDIPVLVEIIKDERALTLRLYEEVINGQSTIRQNQIEDDGRRADFIGQHNRVRSEDGEFRAPIPSNIHISGATLAERFTGRFFTDCGSSTLDLDFKHGVKRGAEWTENNCLMWMWDTMQRRLSDAPVSLNSELFLGKETINKYRNRIGRWGVLRLLIPFETSNVEDCSIIALSHPEYGIIGNIENWSKDEIFPNHPLSLQLISGGGAIAPDATSEIEVEVISNVTGKKLDDADCWLFSEATGGYLPLRRARAEAGRARFRIIARDLTPGDKFKVKIGFKTYSGVLDVDFEVAS